MRRRRSIRLKGYDYAQEGAYYITVCTRDRLPFFENKSIRAIVEGCWLEVPRHFPMVELDEWVVMPDHMHGIIAITRRGVQLNAPTHAERDAPTHAERDAPTHAERDAPTHAERDAPTHAERDAPTHAEGDAPTHAEGDAPTHIRGRDPTDPFSIMSPGRRTLAVIVRTYKAAVTSTCRRAGHAEFGWQRNYYEHVIRDEADLDRTRQYVLDNPQRWDIDRDDPALW